MALIPVTGGIFTVTMTHATTNSPSDATNSTTQPNSVATVKDTVIWDRKTEGGFPETKEMKNRVRNIIEPDRDLGHIDRSLKKGKGQGQAVKEEENEEEKMDQAAEAEKNQPAGGENGNSKGDCEDCK